MKSNLIHEEVFTQIKDVITMKRIEEIAKETNFIQRTSNKINAEIFFNLNVFSKSNVCVESLNNLCNLLLLDEDISISSQSLDERFNEKAVCFLKQVFFEMLSNKIDLLKSSIPNEFKRILITDATGFQLPNEFEEIFKGFSGSAKKAGIKIQLTNDLLTGNIIALELSDGRKSDVKHLKTLEKITTNGDLCLKDLGYFSLKHFQEIESLDSYYVSRLKTNSSVFIINPSPEKFKSGKIKEVSM